METQTCCLVLIKIMRKIRVIPRLDIKSPNLIKGVHLEGLKVVGEPSAYALNYYQQNADELIYMDAVASLYERNSILSEIQKAAAEIFIPITVGGGIRSLSDARAALRSGADKIAVNTAAVKNPQLISEIADSFGAQCVVVSIEAKKKSEDYWEVYTENGREKTGLNVEKWVEQIQKLGAGEILLTSIDCEGTMSGFDIPLVEKVCSNSSIPVIASGGMGSLEHLLPLIEKTSVDAVAVASLLHFNKLQISDIHSFFSKYKM